MKRFKLLLAGFAFMAFGAFAFVPAAPVGAIDPLAATCEENPRAQVCKEYLKGNNDAGTLITTIINVLLFIVGALAVIMIIISGIQYVISSGDAGKVAKAKNTLTYSVVGLVIAFIAFAIVNWVLVVL